MKRVCLIVALLCMILTGCGGIEVKDRQAIKMDILEEGKILEDCLPAITWVEILDRHTDEDNMTDRVVVLLEGKIELTTFTCQYKLDYKYSEKNGWVLKKIRPYHEEDWTIACPNEKRLKEDLMKANAMDLPAGITVKSIELTEAIHSEDLRKCTVFAEVRGNTYYGQGVFPVCASYELDAWGWDYLQCTTDYKNAEITIEAGVDEKYVLKDAAEQFGDQGTYIVTGCSDDYECGRQVWYLQGRIPGEYTDEICDLQISYYFEESRMDWMLEGVDVLRVDYQ